MESNIINKKRIVIIGTGGTIAGAAGSPEQTAGYVSGQVSVRDLVAAVPGIGELADIRAEQLCNVGSEDMTPDAWLMLSRRINELFSRDEADGVVVTHGTDTMEETGFFLDLTVKSTRPVVITGAMLPSTALGADGPLNLYNAVTAAASDKLQGAGTVCCMDQLIIAARYMRKENSFRRGAFSGGEQGIIGYTENGRVTMYQRAMRVHTADTVFDVRDAETLPAVEIIPVYPGMDMRVPELVLRDLRPAGIVIAGYGDGSMPEAMRELVKLHAGETVIVRSGRTGRGSVLRNGEFQDDLWGTVTADDLSPQKARVLLMLALTVTDDRSVVQELFCNY